MPIGSSPTATLDTSYVKDPGKSSLPTASLSQMEHVSKRTLDVGTGWVVLKLRLAWWSHVKLS
jgi:hypothetical protein